MRILYVAKHGQQSSADDEGAIAHALRQLGHEVTLVGEDDGKSPRMFPADLLLFHKWGSVQCLRQIDHVPVKAFWYFDRVVGWHPKRRAWMERTLPWVDVGFATDGDWVEECKQVTNPLDPTKPGRVPDEISKMVWLPQGADERVVGRGTPNPALAVDVLCVAGTRFHGPERRSFVAELGEFCREKGYSFRHVEEGVYREALRDLVASAKVVVAPDSPVTDRYWSNRVYNMLGFGAFLLHPWCEGLEGAYLDPSHLKFYSGKPHLRQLLENCVDNEVYRRHVSSSALERTKEQHLYRHRCEQLIRTVEERTK